LGQAIEPLHGSCNVDAGKGEKTAASASNGQKTLDFLPHPIDLAKKTATSLFHPDSI
jgi:hypothetical protein